jgi:NTP pyrophosphatase (non-canonical NTP hydrolase)
MTEEQVKILHDAVQTYGKQSQVDKAIEEMSELIKALLKERHSNGSVDDIIEEIADVYIMLSQLCLIFEAGVAADEFVDYKLKRLDRRLNGEVLE